MKDEFKNLKCIELYPEAATLNVLCCNDNQTISKD